MSTVATWLAVPLLTGLMAVPDPANADGCVDRTGGPVNWDHFDDPNRPSCGARPKPRPRPVRRRVEVIDPPRCATCRVSRPARPSPPPRYVPEPAYERPHIVAAPAPIWCGTYIGGHLGLSYTNLDFERTGTTASRTGSVFAFGAHVGTNWQYGQFVIGLEADLGHRGILGPKGVPAFGPTASVEGGVPWLATGRARFGFAFDRAFLYGTAGVALGRVDATLAGPGQSLSIEQWRFGTVWGAGLEYLLTDSLSGRFEVLRTDLGSERVSAGGLSTRIGASDTSVRVGLSFRF